MLFLKILAIMIPISAGLIRVGLDYKWYDKRTSTHKLIRKILVVCMIFGFIVAPIIVWHDHEQSITQFNTIKRTENNLKNLQSQIQPFLDLASNKYPNLEIEDALNKIQQELSETKKLAAPNVIIPFASEINKRNGSYQVLLQFESSKNEVLGKLIFEVSIISNSNAKITKLYPSSKGVIFSISSNAATISDDGKKAKLNFAPVTAGYPVIEIVVSDECVLEIKGNHGLNPFNFEVSK